MSTNTDRNALICAMRREGVGPREIARRMGLSPSTVSGVLSRAGLATRALGRGCTEPAFRDLVVAYSREHTIRAAADTYKVHLNTVVRWRRTARELAL